MLPTQSRCLRVFVNEVLEHDSLLHVLHVDTIINVVHVVHCRGPDPQASALAQRPTLQSYTLY